MLTFDNRVEHEENYPFIVENTIVGAAVGATLGFIGTYATTVYFVRQSQEWFTPFSKDSFFSIFTKGLELTNELQFSLYGMNIKILDAALIAGTVIGATYGAAQTILRQETD